MEAAILASVICCFVSGWNKLSGELDLRLPMRGGGGVWLRLLWLWLRVDDDAEDVEDAEDVQG